MSLMQSVEEDRSSVVRPLQSLLTWRMLIASASFQATALPHPLFQHLSTRWKFAPETSKSPSTRIDFELRYAFTSPLYTAVAGGVFKDLSVRMMESFEARAQTLYGRR